MTIITQSGDQLLYEKETYTFRGICINLFKELGPGHKESVYHKALIQELKEKGVPFESEVMVPMIRKGQKIGTYRPDFILWD